MEYIDYSGQAGAQEADDDFANHFSAPAYIPNPASNHSYRGPPYAPTGSCDIKPRLTKEQHDILEAHYQKQNKPNTNTKKGFADALNVSLDKVNVGRWNTYGECSR